MCVCVCVCVCCFVLLSPALLAVVFCGLQLKEEAALKVKEEQKQAQEESERLAKQSAKVKAETAKTAEEAERVRRVATRVVRPSLNLNHLKAKVQACPHRVLAYVFWARMLSCDG